METYIISEAMAILGRRTSAAKATASRANGQLGGRPKGSKNKRKKEEDHG
jgi:hypothetical protein